MAAMRNEDQRALCDEPETDPYAAPRTSSKRRSQPTILVPTGERLAHHILLFFLGISRRSSVAQTVSASREPELIPFWACCARSAATAAAMRSARWPPSGSGRAATDIISPTIAFWSPTCRQNGLSWPRRYPWAVWSKNC